MSNPKGEAAPNSPKSASPKQAQQPEQLPRPSLNKPWRNVTPRMIASLQSGPSSQALVVVSSGSVVPFAGNAIVNAANTGCLGGGGVDGAISAAGGPELLEARKRLPLLEGHRSWRCATGDAKLTVGGDLRAEHCIHAVGPNYLVLRGLGQSLEDGDRLLHSAYQRSMEIAKEKKFKTLAFSLLSAGIFRGERPLNHVIAIGVNAVMNNVYEGLEEVHLVGFRQDEIEALCEAVEFIAQKLSSSKC